MKTYEEAIAKMAATLKNAWVHENMSNYTSYSLSGQAAMVAFLFGKTEDEVVADVKAAAE